MGFGAVPPDRRPLDGIDILRQVEERRPEVSRRFFFRYRRAAITWWAVRDGNSKYIRKRDGDKTEAWLFDLTADPGELHSLLAQRSEEGRRMTSLLERWEKDVQHTR